MLFSLLVFHLGTQTKKNISCSHFIWTMFAPHICILLFLNIQPTRWWAIVYMYILKHAVYTRENQPRRMTENMLIWNQKAPVKSSWQDEKSSTAHSDTASLHLLASLYRRCKNIVFIKTNQFHFSRRSLNTRHFPSWCFVKTTGFCDFWMLRIYISENVYRLEFCLIILACVRWSVGVVT